MFKIIFGINTLILITALIFWFIGIRCFKNDKYDNKGIKYILLGTNITGICIILISILFLPVFLAI
ncbi:hypothetical protein [Clostridium lacusfryxellense]|uniref:hypothetical protein n=1 Tax=Clostridium lacusfryxellense TaxID=205328 RepID=UPI001C0DB3B2|nr:hypothetical protein [Clostridium lacusfryxellense]MBU3112312.1 hypothetical protein [Clostridium lacusfryxellense]